VADPQQPDDVDDEALGGTREQDDDQQADDQLYPEIRKLRAEAKRLRLERNELRDRNKQYEDRDKTEQQRQAEEVAAASRRADDAERELQRYKVAAELGIPQHAGRLRGTTREELVEDARALQREFGLDGTQPDERADFGSGVRRPVQRPKTMNDILRQAAGR